LEHTFIALLNGLSYGLLLFMLSAGLTLVFSLMGVLNFAHASFYMLGAYLGYALSQVLGFWVALVLAPVLVGCMGAAFERVCLRRVHAFGHVPELLVTFGLSYIVLELVQLVWGQSALPFRLPALLQGPAFTLVSPVAGGWQLVWGAAPLLCADAALARCAPFPASRAFIMLVALGMWLVVWLLLRASRVGLVIQAARTHPETVQTLGHNLPRILMGLFGAGTALAALAGVLGGSTFVTQPSMAASLGSLMFVVVVVGGLGSLAGAFWASLLIGMLQTLAVTLDHSLASLLQTWLPATAVPQHALLNISLAQIAPLLPYLVLVLVLVLRPQGLLGRRGGG